MKLVLPRVFLCLIGAISGLLAGAGVWFLFFAFYIFLLSAANPNAKTVFQDIGPQLCALTGAAAGLIAGGICGFLRLKKQTAMIAFALFNFAIAALLISDDAFTSAQSVLRTLVIGSAIFHIGFGVLTAWITASLYSFIGELLDGTYRGELFGLNRGRQEEITSLNIAYTTPRERGTRIKPETQPTVEAMQEIEIEDIPELIFEPGRDWDFINGTAPEATSAKFSYVFLDNQVDKDSINRISAELLPFETIALNEKTHSLRNFQLYKQRSNVAEKPGVTYRTGTLKPGTDPIASPQTGNRKISG